jgi:hypothetical protein
MAQLIFYEDTHTYELDGKKIPSISEIIKPLGDDVDDADLENAFEIAAERGVTCHAILAQLLTGNTDIEYPSVYGVYIDAIRLFISEHEIIPMAIETPIHGIQTSVAGTPDLLCMFDGVLSILDYKFVSQIAKTKVKAQLNGYRIMFNEQGVFPDQLLAIHFKNDGLYRSYDVAIDDEEIRLCIRLYELKNKKHTRGKID